MSKYSRLRRKQAGGIVAQSIDGRTWTWPLSGLIYRWCLLGHLEVVLGKRVARIAFWKTLEAAMAYTAGYADAGHDQRRGEMRGRYQNGTAVPGVPEPPLGK